MDVTTRTEEERLSVVETHIEALSKALDSLSAQVQTRASGQDVSEMRSDVKMIMQSQQQMALALAVRAATDESNRAARGDTGIWVRSIIPWLIALCSLAFTFYHAFLE